MACSFNRDIVECKEDYTDQNTKKARCFNRDIVECKDCYRDGSNNW